MSKLSDLLSQVPANSTLIYGLPKTGKSTLAASVISSYNIHWFDSENGLALLQRIIPVSRRENFFYYSVRDTVTETNASTLYPKIISPAGVKFCSAHSRINCAACKSQETFSISSLDPAKDCIVFDSLSQFSDSIKNAIAGKKDKLDYDDWARVGLRLSAFFSYIQAAAVPIICIAHAETMQDEDNIEKFFPTIGTRAFSPKVSKYFSHTIYTRILNGKFTAISSGTNNPKIPAGTRSDIKLESGSHSLVDLWKPNQI